jgi:uncharacterized membrane protein
MARLWAGYWTHGFLLWNLFLALVPVVLALAAWRLSAGRPKLLALLPILGLWLLFLPNAPYIVTDLVHVNAYGDPIPRLAAALIVSLAAATGVLAALLSLAMVESIVRRRFGAGVSRLMLAIVIPLTAMGVYLGRVVRLNSWDALLEPWSVAGTVLGALANPGDHERAIAFVVFFAAFLAVAYACYGRLALRFPRRRRDR